MSQGVIYIATGRKYIEEACQSAESLKANVPAMSVTLFADEKIDSPLFDQVVPIEKPGPFKSASLHRRMSPKVVYIGMSPYDYTLYLDTDTYICGDISDLFPLLERFDLAVAHDANRTPRRLAQKQPELPNSFAQLNAGIILFKASSHMRAFLSEWLRLYQEPQYDDYWGDQYAFRLALYKSDLRFATLTPEYNCRFRKPMYLHGSVKILHGRHSDLHGVAKQLNATTQRRICKPQVDRSLWRRLLKRVEMALRQ
jgi:hypothetical protein